MLLTAIIFLPLVGGLVVLLLPQRLARWLAAAFTLVVFALSLWMYFGRTGFGDVLNPQWYVDQPWVNISLGSFHFTVDYALGADGLSMPMIILNGLLSFLAVIGSWRTELRPRFYFAMLLFLETGVMGVFAAFDLFLFILFWEVELIPMFLLIGIWGGANRAYAAWKFLLFTLVGSSFTLAGIFFIYVQTGAKDAKYQFYAAAAPHIGGSLPLFGGTISVGLLLFLLLFAGFAVKLPMWPLHTRLPDAHPEAPTAVGVLYDKAHTRDIDAFGGLGVRMPVESTLFLITCFASLGLPALSGFVAEFLVFTGTFALLPIPTVFSAFGIVITAGYLLWMFRRAFYGPLTLKWSWITDATPREAFTLVALAVVILFVGIYPAPIVDLLKPSLTQILSSVQHVAAVR